MDVAPVTALAGIRSGASGALPQAAREFDALLFQLLWRTAAVPGARASGVSHQLHAAFGDFFAQQLALQHSAGFGALVLRSLEKGA